VSMRETRFSRDKYLGTERVLFKSLTGAAFKCPVSRLGDGRNLDGTAGLCLVPRKGVKKVL
jgi:hypothetical protein